MSKITENRTKWMNTRFTPKEYKVIHSRFKKSMFRSMSEYSRNVLLKKTSNLHVSEQIDGRCSRGVNTDSK
ncbi:plasmid mobilization protein [Albibacterium sp.]|uniref:plasmid mobilization protein n=1 Tax=Albibacterium sp. TaxID=2952885 RepID=UPI0039C877F7